MVIPLRVTQFAINILILIAAAIFTRPKGNIFVSTATMMAMVMKGNQQEEGEEERQEKPAEVGHATERQIHLAVLYTSYPSTQQYTVADPNTEGFPTEVSPQKYIVQTCC